MMKLRTKQTKKAKVIILSLNDCRTMLITRIAGLIRRLCEENRFVSADLSNIIEVSLLLCRAAIDNTILSILSIVDMTYSCSKEITTSLDAFALPACLPASRMRVHHAEITAGIVQAC
jgi:hypothetical protein